MKSKILSFFLFCFFCLVATSSVLAYGEADEIDLVGPQWAVDMVCQQINTVFDGVNIQQVPDDRLDRPHLVFKSPGIPVVSLPINPYAPLPKVAKGLILAWQWDRGIVVKEEFRETDDKPFPRHSSGIQVHASAPIGKPYWEVKDKSPDVKVCEEISSPTTVVFLRCDRVEPEHYRAAIPAAAVRIWGVRDGSDRPVKTLELWTTPSFSCNY